LVAGRAVMGLGAALVMPATLSIITSTFREPAARAQAIALWAATFGLGSGLGPVLGGAVVDRFGWPAVFLVTVPIILVAVGGAWFSVTDSRDPHPAGFDIPGVVLSITGITALVYGIIEAGVTGWTSGPVVVAFCLAAVLLTAFGWWQARAPHPMLPAYLFKNPSFSGANLSLTASSFSLFGVGLSTAQYFQTVQGFDALAAGLVALPLALAVMVLAAASARVAARLGIKTTVLIGMLGVAGGQLLYGFLLTPDQSLWVLIPTFLVIGAGIGLSQGPATTSVMGAVPVSRSGVGSAMNDTARELGGALGIAVLGSILTSVYIQQISANAAAGQVTPQVYAEVTSSIQGAHVFATQITNPQVASQFVTFVNAAFTSGMQASLIAGALIVLAASVVVGFVLPQQIQRPAEDDEDA
jgi:hypothetical protein